MLLKYKPVRIIQKFSVVAKTIEKMNELFPNAIIESRVPVVAGYYKPGSVVDAPSKEEHGLFEHLSDLLVAYIPQVDGFDDPKSGLARSRKASWRGKQKWVRSMDGAKFEVPQKAVEMKPLDDITESVPFIKAVEEVKEIKSKFDDAKKPSRRKKKDKHLVQNTDDDLNIDDKNNEVIESDE